MSEPTHTPPPNEEQLLERIFGSDNGGWKGRYPIIWCELCECLAISCPDCPATSCNCGGCEKCSADTTEFNKLKSDVRDYLSPEERKVILKASFLKKYIKECLYAGFPAINWGYLRDSGKTCLEAVFLFEELRSYREYAVHEHLEYANTPEMLKTMKEGVDKLYKKYP